MKRIDILSKHKFDRKFVDLSLKGNLELET